MCRSQKKRAFDGNNYNRSQSACSFLVNLNEVDSQLPGYSVWWNEKNQLAVIVCFQQIALFNNTIKIAKTIKHKIANQFSAPVVVPLLCINI